MIYNERDLRNEQALFVARQMMTAARTAPKGKGVDIIETATVTGNEIVILSEKMKQLYETNGMKFFLRDADNILSAQAVVLIGTRPKEQGLNCGHCGYAACADRKPGVPCAINTIDVGIGNLADAVCNFRYRNTTQRAPVRFIFTDKSNHQSCFSLASKRNTGLTGGKCLGEICCRCNR